MTNKIISYIGIDYSGARTAVSRLKGLQIFKATHNVGPTRVQICAGEKWNWSRKEIAQWCFQ